jgi:hypothetical protein
MLKFNERINLLKKYWWVLLLIVIAFTVFPVITAKHTPFEGKWKEENTNIIWSFGSTGYDTTNEQGLITFNGNYSYTENEITCVSHPSGSPNLNHSVTYTYRLEGDKLYFDSPVHLVFTKLK